MNKQTFITLIKDIKEQVKIDNKRMNLIEEAFGPDNYIFIPNRLMDRLVLVLLEYTNLNEDDFYDFIYSEDDKTDAEIEAIYKITSKEKSYTIDACENWQKRTASSKSVLKEIQ